MGKGANYLNNNKGVALQASKKQTATKMVECQYGAGCTRKKCIYSHPDVKNSDVKGIFKQSQEPCMAYLAGICSFTATGCRKRHPLKEEAEKLIAKYQMTKCRFGDACKTNGCLYLHPSDKEEEEEEVEHPNNTQCGQFHANAMSAYYNVQVQNNRYDKSYDYQPQYQQQQQQQQRFYHDPSVMFHYQQQQGQQRQEYYQEYPYEECLAQNQSEQTSNDVYANNNDQSQIIKNDGREYGIDVGMNPNAAEWKPSFS